ncbi:putative L-lysine 2,3-aminomutase [Seiridium unicorne]|uniref:L-lysine 2,3-aminomutase n=1 Tax=Seiridium unicorne TaxID=138068 RepID=A0ABR2UF83_9PEZI
MSPLIRLRHFTPKQHVGRENLVSHLHRMLSTSLKEVHETLNPVGHDSVVVPDPTPVTYLAKAVGSEETYWKNIPRWGGISTSQFLSHKWQMSNTVQSEKALCEFLAAVLPQDIPPQWDMEEHLRITDIHTPEKFIARVKEGIKRAPMAVRLSPPILSVINWKDPINDPVRRQFIPLASPLNIDHPMAVLDHMQENKYSPVPGLIHRYPDRALFFALVGAGTDTIKKQRFLPLIKKWEPRFEYIEKTPSLEDIVVSGGDTYLLDGPQIRHIGERLLRIPHIRRFRFASKGLSVSPSRLLDPDDDWVDTITELKHRARKLGKHVCIHTHFNSVNEISWVTRRGAQRLYEAGVTVRNQSVLLNGVNNSPEAMCALVHELGNMNIQPYYVYQGDVVPGAEDLRTPMQHSLDLERAVRGQIAGFLVPNFILDLPAEGGLKGEPVEYEYWDPLWSLSKEGQAEVLERCRKD